MRIFWLFVLFSLVAFRVNAQNEDFSAPHQELGHIQEIQKPKCSDEALKEKIRQTAEIYMSQKPLSSTMAKRRKFLKLQNLKDFVAENVKGFSPDKDYRMANALIMLKINEHLNDEDIILCKQQSVKKNPIYVVVYPYLDNYKGYIINLDEKNSDYDAITFIYP